MIKQIKMGFRMLRYSYGKGLCIGIFVFGIAIIGLLEWISAAAGNERGVGAEILLMISGLLLAQLVHTLGVSGMVQSSGWGRQFQVSIPALLAGLGVLASYAVVLVVELLRLGKAEEGLLSERVLLWAIVGAGILLYSGVAFKWFTASMIVYIALFCPLFHFMPQYFSRAEEGGALSELPFAAAAGLGLLILLAAMLLGYVLLRLNYRRPYDRQAQMGKLRKLM